MRRVGVIVAGFLALACGGAARPAAPPHWIATWGSAQLPLEAKDALPAEAVTAAGVTVVQTMRVSAGGTRLRVRLSNAFGAEPLVVGTAALDGVTALTFAGLPSATIPPGAELYSDPTAATVRPGGEVRLSLRLTSLPTRQTGHPGARATTLVGSSKVTRWFVASDVEVEAPASVGTIAVIGDSITDGYGVKPDSNTRWTDTLAARMRVDARWRGWGVVNAGIGGNRVTLDGSGPNLPARFDRDVIARAGVRTAIVLEGVNDLGTLTRDAPATPAEHAALVRRITAGYREIVARAHAHGIRVVGGTILPFGGNDYYHPTAANEADRRAVNAFIRDDDTFDAVIDFDRALADPAHPDRLAPALDSGDHLHPSIAGYAAMGAAVPLALLADGATPAATPPRIALTFDDIAVHGDVPPGWTRERVVGTIARTLVAEHVPAHGFLNAGPNAGNADALAGAAAWKRARLPMGNHTRDHRNLDDLDAAAFRDQLTSNEAEVAAANGGTAEDARWFRYPFLSEGRDANRRDAARAILAERGYRIAAVTMSFADYDYNPVWVRCMAKRDVVNAAAVERAWLDAARTEALRKHAAARAVFGRDVPQVLLLHVGALDAVMLPRLLALYRSLGFGFATLPQAEADPFYAAALDPQLPGPSPSLERAATEAGYTMLPAPDATTIRDLCA